ncbi:MAG: Hpt domain-containing protein [Ideonella sp.]|nr:Hpt domain-containing protein [Ideonella sp.]MCC7456832.1 Hpt domain-containing protein [Nitrospira sp.]
MSVARDNEVTHDLSALAWVHDELRRTLEAAHKSLRRYLKEADALGGSDVDTVDPSILRHARSQMHQGAGALELVGLPTAALMLRASEAAIGRLAAKPRGLTPAAVDIVERGSFALLDYLARLLAGKLLSPAAMFPQYKGLQELAGAGRVHPADLWNRDWQWRTIEPREAVTARRPDADTQAQLEAETLALMRRRDAGAAQRMSDLFAGLAAGSRDRLATLWLLAAAVYEAQASGLLKADLYGKRLASRLLAQLRAGDTAEASDRLAQDLLFFCAQAVPAEGKAAGSRLAAARQAFELKNTAAVDYDSARLGRFDPALLAQARKRVAAAKDVWSAVAGGDNQRLPGLSEQFALVGESLGRLYPEGEVLAKSLQQAAAHAVHAGGHVTPEHAMEVATSLLYLDASLEDQDLDHPELAGRVQRLAQRIDGVRQGHAAGALEVWMEDLYRRVSDRQTMGSVVQELRASLSEIEKHIDQFFRDPGQREVLIPVPAQLSSMRGVLSVLGQDHASHAVVRMRDDVDALIAVDASHAGPQSGAFDRLADNLGALSFLIDMLSVQPQMAKSLFRFDAASGNLQSVMDRAQRPSVFGALEPKPADEQGLVERAGAIAKSAAAGADAGDVARELERLARQAEAADQRGIASAAGQAQRALEKADSDDEQKQALAQAAQVMGELSKPQVDALQSRPMPLKPLAPPAPPAPPGQTGLEEDTEMREIFLEEAREVMQTARDALAQLAKVPTDMGEMTSVRRAFHTLKGSSRMVGLRDFGEAAWGCEQLFNARLADGGGADGDLLAFSLEAIDYLGRWIDGITSGRTEGFDHRVVGRAADSLRNDRRRISLADAASSRFGALAGEPASVAPEAAAKAMPPAPAAVSAAAAAAVPVATPPADQPVLDITELASPQPESSESAALPTPELVIDLDFGADAATAEAPTEILDLPTQTMPIGPAPAAGAAPPSDPFDLIEIDLPEIAAEPLPPRDVSAAPDTRPDALQTMPAALGPFIDSETGRLDDAPASRREAEPVAEATLHESAAEHEQVKVIGPLRIQIPLFNIFLSEADEQSRRLSTEIAEWSHELQRPVGESTVAHAHSLAGNCATVGYTDLSNLARALEHALARTHARGFGVAEEAQLFAAAAEEVRGLLHQFAAGFLKSPDPDLLRFLAEHEHFTVPAPAAPEAPVRPVAEFAPQFTEFGHTELRTLGEGLAAPTRAADLGASARPDALDDEDDIDAVDAVDAELFPIFEEEGQELIPQLQARMREWMRRPTEAAAASACMRTLHTLKGGARLAGAMRLGEMAHRLETAIEHLVGRGHASAAEVERLVARVDAIETRFEMLRRGEADHSQPMPLASESAAAQPGEATAPVPTMEPLAPFTAVSAVVPAVAQPQPQPMQAAVAAERGATAIDWSRFSVEAPAAATAEPATVGTSAQSAVRVRSQLLDRLVSHAGEVSITRSRIESDVVQLKASLGDLTENLERLRRQLRDLELQAETQITSRMEAAKASSQEFDPLEMDRFTRFQELTRMMAESVNDVATVQRGLQRTLQSTEDELAAQARLTRDLQDDLLRTRMVEFEGMSERLYRLVRQAAKETGKQVRLDIVGGAIEVDRGVLDRMTGSFEHLLRNSVTHGVESPAARAAAGKDPTGSIVITVAQEGNEVAVEFRDDGAGLNLPRIRDKGRAMGLIAAGTDPSDAELANLIFAPGFTTAEAVTGLAGRGVGMDVVRADVNAMGGRIETATAAGRGTSFRLVLPLTTAVTQVVMLRCGELKVAVPSTLVEIVKRSPAAELETAYATSALRLDDRSLPFFWLGALLQANARGTLGTRAQPVVIIRSAAQRVALHVDEVLGNQEVVVKNLGPQLARLPGLAGMTLLPSGEPALIYNPVALATLYGESAWAMTRAAMAGAPDAPGVTEAVPAEALPPLVLVVDDSLTVRRVTQRLLQREGYRVTLAKDGLEGLERLAEERPAVLLSDIEMPRMDGFDLVRNLRADVKLADLPVIMITSRIAQKHKDYAAELGVDHYLGKPYAEEDLLALVARYAKVAVPSA